MLRRVTASGQIESGPGGEATRESLVMKVSLNTARQGIQPAREPEAVVCLNTQDERLKSNKTNCNFMFL